MLHTVTAMPKSGRWCKARANLAGTTSSSEGQMHLCKAPSLQGLDGEGDPDVPGDMSSLSLGANCPFAPGKCVLANSKTKRQKFDLEKRIQ